MECLHVSHHIAKYGKAEVLQTYNNQSYVTTPIRTIDEFTFYSIFLELEKVLNHRIVDGEVTEENITKPEAELLCHLMTKPLDFEMTYRDSKNQLEEIGKELNERTLGSINKSFIGLKNKKYLVKTEDGMYIPCPKLDDLRKKTKKSIEVNGHFCHDYLFKFCVK